MTIELFLGIVSTLSVTVLGFLQWRNTAAKVKSENNKSDIERQEIEDRITQRVLERAEAELAKYKTDNNELREDNARLRRDNADLLKMVRAMRILTAKLVRKIEQAGIDPELTDEERAALDDTGELSKYAKK